MKARLGQEGFLTDLELSSIEGEVVVEMEVMNVMPQIYAQSTAKDTAKNALKNPPAFVRTSEAAQRGAMMTVMQFPRIPLLQLSLTLSTAGNGSIHGYRYLAGDI